MLRLFAFLVLYATLAASEEMDMTLALSDGSQQPLTLITGHEEAFTENQQTTHTESCAVGDVEVYSPSYYCNSCVGASQYSTCGDRGVNGRSFCSYDYTGAPICLQNQYCSEITRTCSSHANCDSDQACAIAACSSSYYCHKRCSTSSTPTPAPTPSSPPTQCSSCIGKSQYSQCGTRGYNDNSFCSYDYLGSPVCMQNDLCSSITRFCSNNNDCYSNEVCGKAACSSSNKCYRRCDSTDTPPPAPLPTVAPTRLPTRSPTPTTRPGQCNSCAGKEQYSVCGDQGLNDKSICSYDYTGTWVCLKNGYCSDYPVFCSTHNDCGPGQTCAYAGCSTNTKCYDRCDGGYHPPSPHPSLPPQFDPTPQPTRVPTHHPSIGSNHPPSHHPSLPPQFDPTPQPTRVPTHHPSIGSNHPPSHHPSLPPQFDPIPQPTRVPTHHPSIGSNHPPSHHPSLPPQFDPTPQPTRVPTHQPSVHPTRSPTRMPVTPVCSSCVGSEKYAQCGSRGLHDYSFCTNDELGGPVCIQNMYCSDVIRACNSTEQCEAGDVCSLSGCTPNKYHCYRRCESPLNVGPPSPSPTMESEQRSKDKDNDLGSATTITVFAVIFVALLCLVMVAICVYVGCKQAMKKHAEAPAIYAVKASPTGQLTFSQNDSKI